MQVVALVGPSGGGKSSIVKLVERFYLPAAGAVRMDGRDVGIYDEKWLRRRVGIVSQEPTLYCRRLSSFLAHTYIVHIWCTQQYHVLMTRSQIYWPEAFCCLPSCVL